MSGVGEVGLIAAQRCLARRLPSGDPAWLRAAARRSGGLAEELRRTSRALSGYQEAMDWSGAGQRAFVVAMSDRAPDLGRVAGRYEQYAVALIGYAGVLDRVQPQLLRLHAQLREGCAPAAGQLPGSAGDADRDERLAVLARDFDQAWQEWDAGLRRCVHALGQAGSVWRDRSGWSSFGHGLVRVLSELSPVTPLLDHSGLAGLSHALGNLGNHLAIAGLVLLVVCPPAAAACFAAAAVMSAAQLATDAVRAGRHDPGVGLGALGLDAMAALPGGRLLREGETGARAAKSIEALTENERSVRLVPGGGLAAHESITGDAAMGHTIRKHIEIPTQVLLERLRTEPHISHASAFSSRAMAENSISEIIARHDDIIANWLTGSKGGIGLSGKFFEPVGVSIPRDGEELMHVSGLKVILRRDHPTSAGYRIHTAYPQP
ncbi:MAG: RNase A-like domain-containing protein [Jatrophihabitans sp.]